MKKNNTDFSDIPDERLCGESPLACAKKVELRILRIFDRICRKHGLLYCLCGGTLLGAVRHKGFIPWDDDIDVHMPLSDYKKFMKIAKDELPDGIAFYHGKNTQCGFGKLMDLNSYYQDDSVRFPGATMPQGIFVDIFPLRRYRCAKLFKILVPLAHRARLDSLPFGRVSIASLVRKWFWKCIYCGVCFLDWMNASEKGKWLGAPMSMWGSPNVYSADVFPPSEIEFEGFAFFAPGDPHAYLVSNFGADYMSPPPLQNEESMQKPSCLRLNRSILHTVESIRLKLRPQPSIMVD